MNKKQEDFLRELLADYMVEANEHRQAIVTGLLELEKDQNQEDRQKLVEMTFREVHSLKGASRAVNLLDVERLCQSIESVFSLLKQQSITPTRYFFNTLHSAMNLLEQYLNDITTQQKTVNSDRAVRIINDIQGLCKVLEPKSTPKMDAIAEKHSLPSITDTNSLNTYTPVSSPKKNESEINIKKFELNEIKQQDHQFAENNPTLIDIGGSKDTVRISTAKLTELLIQAEELITSKSMIGYDLRELKLIDQLMSNKLKSLDGQDDQLKKIRDDLHILGKNMDQHYRIFYRTVDDLLFNIKKTLLLPFSQGLDWLPKLVRDLSNDIQKQVNLSVKGDEMEIDRRILEKIKVPLIHLIRNSIDHGIETPEQRLKNHKSSIGNLSLVITQHNNREVILTLSDDGAGINREKVLQASLKAGIISPERSVIKGLVDIPELKIRL